MANYAVIVDGIVNNVIVADSLEIAEEVTGFTCIEYTDDAPYRIGDELKKASKKTVE